MDELTEIAEKINQLDSKEDVRNFLLEIFTKTQYSILMKHECFVGQICSSQWNRFF